MENQRNQHTCSLIKEKFGKSFFQDLMVLVNLLKERDEIISLYIDDSLENLLLLNSIQAPVILSFLHELSKTSAFAATFFIEKIPLLLYFSLLDVYVTFVKKIKDFNARHISYLLGSYHLKADDLQDILDQVDIDYYQALITKVENNSLKLRAISASVMINSIGIYKSVKKQDIDEYLDLCIAIYTKYGFDVAELFLKNTEQILKKLSLKNILSTLDTVSFYGTNYLQLFLMFSNKIPSKLKQKTSHQKINKNTILSLFTKDPLEKISENIEILENNYLFAIIANWHTFSEKQKKQIIDQLNQDDYKNFLLNNKLLKTEVDLIKSLSNNWFRDWHSPQFNFDDKFIYSQIKMTIYSGHSYSLDEKSIQIKLNEIRDKTTNSKQRVLEILSFLKKISISKENLTLLEMFYLSLEKNNLFELIPYLSNKGKLFIQTWARNPWLDYSRSDELFACTSIGDYASNNSPCFLADLNISNLDIWSNGNRIGRIHFYLLKDKDKLPILLVDRINGSDRLMRHQKRLEELYNGILKYSQYLGLKKIFFNSKISFNNTPKQFVNYLASKKIKKTFLYVARFIDKGGLNKILNTIDNSFLEAMESKDSHVIEGYLVNI